MNQTIRFFGSKKNFFVSKMSELKKELKNQISVLKEKMNGEISVHFRDVAIFDFSEFIEDPIKMLCVVEAAKRLGARKVYIKDIPLSVCKELSDVLVELMSGNITSVVITTMFWADFDEDFVGRLFSIFKTRNSIQELFVSVSLAKNKIVRDYLSGRSKLKRINFGLESLAEPEHFRFCVEDITNRAISVSFTFSTKTDWGKMTEILKYVKKPVPLAGFSFHYVLYDRGGITQFFQQLGRWHIDLVAFMSCIIPLPIEYLKNVSRLEIGLGQEELSSYLTKELLEGEFGYKLDGSVDEFLVSKCRESALAMLRNLKETNPRKLVSLVCALVGPEISREMREINEKRLAIGPNTLSRDGLTLTHTPPAPVPLLETKTNKRLRRPRVFLPKDKEAVIAECFSEPLVDTIPTTSVEESEEDTICSDQLCTKSVIKSTDYFYELVCSSPDKHIVRYHKACKRLDVPCHCESVWQVCHYVQERDGERTVKHTEVLVDDNSVLESILTPGLQSEADHDPEPEPEAELEAEPASEPEPVADIADAPKIVIHRPKFVFEKSKQTRRAEVANEFKIKRNQKAPRQKKQTSSPAKQASSPAEQVCNALLKKGFFSPLEECQGALDRSLSSVSLAIDLLLSWHRQQSM